MLFGRRVKKKPLKKAKKLTTAGKEKLHLKKALIEDPSIRRECRSAENAEDIYDEDDFND